MVPDFEVELDAIIDEGAMEAAKIFDGESNIEDIRNVRTVENPQDGVNRGNRIKIAVIFAGIFILVGSFMFAITNFNRYFSFEYQYEKALKYYNMGNYADALKTSKHAMELNRDDRRASLLLADSYIELEKYDEALAILYSMLDKNNDDAEVYDRLLDCILATENYDEIATLYEKSPTDEIKSKFKAYLAPPVEFSEPEGEYEDDLKIWLKADAPGRIFYTLDGSEPDEGSLIYDKEIELTEGETTISAILINEYGLKSQVVSKSYTIDYGFVEVPKLVQKSGNYAIPKPIEVEYPEDYVCYYTDNGENPTEESNIYSGPILMPIGRTEYRFMCVDSRNRKSDVIVAVYSPNMNCLIDKDTAVNAIQFQLMSRGDDIMGNSYRVNYAYGKDNSSFYVIDEYKGKSKTGRQFAVDTVFGTLYSIRYNEESRKFIINNI